jgi:hypothetical protein
MIFKHEFLIDKHHPDYLRGMKSRKDNCEYELGKMVGDIFGWKPVETPPHIHAEEDRYKLEVIAFRIEDWDMFRRRLNHFFPNRDLDTLLYDLEHFNPQNQNNDTEGTTQD